MFYEKCDEFTIFFGLLYQGANHSIFLEKGHYLPLSGAGETYFRMDGQTKFEAPVVKRRPWGIPGRFNGCKHLSIWDFLLKLVYRVITNCNHVRRSRNQTKSDPYWATTSFSLGQFWKVFRQTSFIIFGTLFRLYICALSIKTMYHSICHIIIIIMGGNTYYKNYLLGICDFSKFWNIHSQHFGQIWITKLLVCTIIPNIGIKTFSGPIMVLVVLLTYRKPGWVDMGWWVDINIHKNIKRDVISIFYCQFSVFFHSQVKWSIYDASCQEMHKFGALFSLYIYYVCIYYIGIQCFIKIYPFEKLLVTLIVLIRGLWSYHH